MYNVHSKEQSSKIARNLLHFFCYIDVKYNVLIYDKYIIIILYTFDITKVTKNMYHVSMYDTKVKFDLKTNN